MTHHESWHSLETIVEQSIYDIHYRCRNIKVKYKMPSMSPSGNLIFYNANRTAVRPRM